MTGTNQAAQTLTAANIGNIRAVTRGRPFVSLGLADLQILNNLDLGFVDAASVAGAAFTYTAVIMASRAGDGNVFDFASQDNAVIEVDLSGVTAVIVDTGTIELFGVAQEGSQLYTPQMFINTMNIVAGGTDNLRLPYDNISHLYFTTPTNVDRLSILKDRAQYVSCSWADLIAFSNMDASIEAAFTTGALVNMQRSGAMGEALTDDVEVSVFAGAGGVAAPHIVSVSLDYTPDILVRSQEMVAEMVKGRLRRKVRLGKARPVTAFQQLVGVKAAQPVSRR